MKELWEQAILSYNLPLTILLGLVLGFWLLSALGTVEVDGFDFDFEADADVNGGGHGLAGLFGFAMRFVNAHEVPVTIILSLLTLFTWAASLLGNYYLNPAQSGWIAAAVIAGGFFLSAFLVKIVTEPLRPFLRSLKSEEEAPEPLIGLVGIVKSGVLDQNFGQIEVPRSSGAPALLNAILAAESEGLSRGAEVLVIDFDSARDKYLVQSTHHLGSSSDPSSNS